MERYEDRFDFHGVGLAIKDAREKRGWTQEYLGQLIDRTAHSIMYMENRGQHPSLAVFYKLVILLDISVDQFFSPKRQMIMNSSTGTSILERLCCCSTGAFPDRLVVGR